MLFGRHVVRLEDDGVTQVPVDGRCSVSFRPRLIECFAPFHKPFAEVNPAPVAAPLRSHQPIRLLSVWDSPLPADFGMNPLSASFPDDAPVSEPEILFLRCEPRAYIRRSFTAANVRLAP
jgi:hypothetical protein